MTALPAHLGLLPVESAETGRRIRERRTRLGMTVKDLAERAGVDRGRLAKLEAGEPAIRATTIGAVEAALDRIEEETGMNDPAAREDGVVEFRVTGNFGVDVVVKGPVRDLAALEESVNRILSRMQKDQRELPPRQ